MAEGPNFQDILDAAIREATERVAYEVERDAEQKVAAILRERGWTVLAPTALGRDSDVVRLSDALEAALSPLPDEQLDKIEKRANAAAEWGGWAIWEDLRDDGFVHVGNLDGVIPDGQIATGEDAEPNPIARCFTREIAEHIVSMDPDRTLALLAEVRRLRALSSRPDEETNIRAKVWQEGWERGFRDTQAAGRDEDGYIVIIPAPNPYRPTSEGSETA